MAQNKIIITTIFFVLFFFCSKAQDTNKYVYQDSSSLVKDSNAAKVTETPPADSGITVTTAPVLPDSVLHFNDLQLSPDSIKALKNATAFAYTKNLDSLLKALKIKSKNEMTESDNGPGWLATLLASSVTKIILWLLAALFVVFVVYKLFFVEGAFMRRINKSNVEELAEQEISANKNEYKKLIAQAVSDKNYRLAIRYLYLQSLQKLSEKELIELVADKTNYQYITELNGTRFKEEFSWLTLNYEYVWYGKFNINEEAFSNLQNSFNQFNNRI